MDSAPDTLVQGGVITQVGATVRGVLGFEQTYNFNNSQRSKVVLLIEEDPRALRNQSTYSAGFKDVFSFPGYIDGFGVNAHVTYAEADGHRGRDEFILEAGAFKTRNMGTDLILVHAAFVDDPKKFKVFKRNYLYPAKNACFTVNKNNTREVIFELDRWNDALGKDMDFETALELAGKIPRREHWTPAPSERNSADQTHVQQAAPMQQLHSQGYVQAPLGSPVAFGGGRPQVQQPPGQPQWRQPGVYQAASPLQLQAHSVPMQVQQPPPQPQWPQPGVYQAASPPHVQAPALPIPPAPLGLRLANGALFSSPYQGPAPSRP